MKSPTKEFSSSHGGERRSTSETFGDVAPWSEPAWYNALDSPYYNDSHKRIRAYVRSYMDQYIMPDHLEWEAKGEAPRKAAKAYARSGLPFLDVPNDYRPKELREVAGIPVDQLDVFHMMIVSDECARVEGGVLTSLAGASVIGVPP